jgi:ornithine decarboxylase
MSKVIPIATEVLWRARSSNQPARLSGTTQDMINALRPSQPVHIIWPERIAEAAKHFLQAFPGETMFAVKTNPDRTVLQTLYKNGVRAFDAASIEEVRLVRKVARKAKIYFMHPVKAPEAIREAYFVHGVRDFSLDTMEELYKITRETDLAPDLGLFVRIALPKNGKAAIDFSSKFGAGPAEAVELLRKCAAASERLGLCFHVGTQTVDANVYARAVSHAAGIIRASGVTLNALDIGGGFPVPYPGQPVASVEQCIETLQKALRKEKLDHLPLLAEPGRVLVAQGGALVARVELRKGNTLYLNDGTYGGLFDAGPILKTRFPVQALRANADLNGNMEEFRFAGPTCDSLDMMAGPFMLPSDIRTGDWIEIGNLGAYSHSLRTNFNGFGSSDTVCLYENPTAMQSQGRKRIKNNV